MFEKLWLQLVTKRPKLAEPESKVEITSENLKILLRQFYDKGIDQGLAGKSLFERTFGPGNY